MRPRVFVTQPIAERALQKLEAVADVARNRDGSRVLPRSELLRAIEDAPTAALHECQRLRVT